MPDLRNHRQLAPTASVYVSPLCLGTMAFGSAQHAVMGDCTKETAFSILDRFYESGGNFLDTANAYQNGESEEWLGEWMAARRNRDEMVIATKYTATFAFPSSATTDTSTTSTSTSTSTTSSSTGGGGGSYTIPTNTRGNGAKSLRNSLATSLRRLQTSYVDVLYVHWWEHTTSVPELMHSLNDLIASGRVLYLGASDTPAWVVSRANQYARDHGLRQFAVYQGRWNAGFRDVEREILPMCKAEGMAVCPYGVLGSGKFQTKEAFRVREEEEKKKGAGGHGGRNFVPVTEHDRRISGALEKVAERKGCGLAQVGLAYVRAKDPNVFVLVGARKLGHLESSIDGLEVELTEEEVTEIESADAFDHGFPSTFLNGSLLTGCVSKAVMGPKDVVVAGVEWSKPHKPTKSG